jgi:hypothetical protein
MSSNLGFISGKNKCTTWWNTFARAKAVALLALAYTYIQTYFIIIEREPQKLPKKTVMDTVSGNVMK